MTRTLVLALAVVLTASVAFGATSKTHVTQIGGWTYIQSPQSPGLFNGGSAKFKLTRGKHKFTITSPLSGSFTLQPGVPGGIYTVTSKMKGYPVVWPATVDLTGEWTGLAWIDDDVNLYFCKSTPCVL